MATGTITETLIDPSSNLTSSISSLSSSQDQSRHIARTYRQAQQLFITRRLQDALSTLEVLTKPPKVENESKESIEDEADEDRMAESTRLAPIVEATRAARVKVWTLYIAIINQIAELGADEGKKQFGAEWKQIFAKASDGSIWTEIIKDGYRDVEANVDADVVANLATLLLSLAQSQKLTQDRLETYLSTAAPTSLDSSFHGDSTNGTSTPRALQSRLKLLEIYTLHVLPRNDEWDYAREFITMSEVLDEERKEVFLQELQALRDEKDGDSERQEELRQQEAKMQQAAEKAAKDAKQRLEAAKAADERPKQPNSTSHERHTSEHDYGIDHSLPNGTVKPTNSAQKGTASSQSTVNGRVSRPLNPPAAAKKAKTTPPGFYRRASSTITALQHAMLHGAQTLTGNPAVLLRVLFMIIAMLALLSRSDVRGRVARITQSSWEKVRRTLGMGVKISYI